MKKLQGKVALITGGSKGIGYGVADALVRQGVDVVITSRHKREVEKAAKELTATGPGRAVGLKSDVRDLASERAAVKQALKEFKHLDIVIANAGVGHFAPIDKLTSKQWQDTIDINLTGVFNTTKASLSALKKSKGYLITIASLAGTNFFPTASAYNASKFGLVGFTQAVMLDVRQDGVKVSTIMPGSVSTYFNNRKPTKAESWKIQPEDIGQIVVDLLNMHPRTLPSKVEVRPSLPPSK